MGWLFRSRATVVNLPPSINSSPNSAQKHELRPATTKSKTKWQTFATQFSKISRPDREVFKENIAPQDRKVVIEALLMQGGPDGFDVHMELMIDQILSAWGGENFEEA